MRMSNLYNIRIQKKGPPKLAPIYKDVALLQVVADSGSRATDMAFKIARKIYGDDCSATSYCYLGQVLIED